MATGSTIIGRAPSRADWHLAYSGRAAVADVLRGPSAVVSQLGRFGTEHACNSLFAGDNLGILRSLCADPTICGKVRLAYIDPPYATGFAFESATIGSAYSDHLQGADYLEGLRQRIVVLRELLADDGSIYLHLDSTMIFHAKIIMDEVFGPQQFRSFITRVKCNPKNQTRNSYGDVCDYVLFYSKSRFYVWNQPVERWSEEAGEKEFNCVEESTGRRFKKVPCHLPGVRYGETGALWRGKAPPPGKHWVHSPKKLEEMDARGEIYWSPTGNPRRKLYLDEVAGKRRSNLWSDFRDTQNQNARITGYPTEKNLEMLRMIVEASSNPGDIVLDAYAGSGTTLAAAGAGGRKWIGIDESPAAIRTALERLVLGTPTMGSHARNSYVKRAIGGASGEAGHSFRLFVDRANVDLREELGRALREEPLVSAFNPVSAQPL
jgi:adenine-specific DNA-methyltransferase